MSWVNYLQKIQKFTEILEDIFIEDLSKSIFRNTPGLAVMTVSKVKNKI